MPLTILYVDDEPDLREIATIALELDGDIAVDTVGSGEEALARLEREVPDLVLLDMMMPVMDGPATHAAIRERFGDALPVIYITARAEESERERLVGLGARGVIAKPFDPMTLSDQVRDLLGS